MDQESERILVGELMENLAGVFKWALDTKPDMSRDSDVRCAVASDPARPRADVILMGGSNCQRLHTTFAEMGVSVETISSRIWAINTKAVDICLNSLIPLLARSDPSIPIVLWGLDNMCFRAENEEGNLTRIVLDPTDGQHHVVGDLVVAPFGLLQTMVRELKRLLAACGDREVWILDVLPRYLIVHCCDNQAHCVNVRRDGRSGTEACKKILTDLAELNALLAAHLTSGNVKMIATGDILTGIKNATSGQLMDCMYSSWNTDAVHGEKVAYTRIGLGLLDIVRKDPPREDSSSSNRKRTAGLAATAAPAALADPDEAALRTGVAATTGGRTTPPTRPAGTGRPTRSTPATSTAEGGAHLAAEAAGAATTNRVVRLPDCILNSGRQIHQQGVSVRSRLLL
jgi:hypothetical protein